MMDSPRLLGIAGPTCSGKTSLAAYLASRLGEGETPVLCLDSYYRDRSHLSPAEREPCDFDVPEALDSDLLSGHLKLLTMGQRIERPEYRFATHTRAPQGVEVEPGEWVIVEGLFSLYWEEVREFLDVGVYVDVKDGVAFARRLARDTRERGRSHESVLRQYRETVRPMADRYVLPTRKYADVVVDGEKKVDVSAAKILRKVEEIARR